MRTILVATSSFDDGHTRPVIDILQQKNCQVVAYRADRVASGEKQFTYRIGVDGDVNFAYDGLALNTRAVSAAWFRRPNLFDVKEPDKLKLQAIDLERKECQRGLWLAIPSRRWLNAPQTMADSDNKITQLRRAQKIGFNIPPTIVSNNWEDIFKYLKTDEVVLKMPYLGQLTIDDTPSYFATTIIKRGQHKPLAKSIPFPGIWQAYIPKKREWRITVVGNKAFSASIYTAEKARADWRVHQFDKSLVEFRSEPFPKELQQKCTELVHSFGLRYGAFDFIEDRRGKIYFLEVNVNGQYQWLVEKLGLPIHEAIASELLQIANAS